MEPGIVFSDEASKTSRDEETHSDERSKSWWQTGNARATAIGSLLLACATAYSAIIGRPVWDIYLHFSKSPATIEQKELVVSRVVFQGEKPKLYRVFANVSNSWYSFPKERLALYKNESWYSQTNRLPAGAGNLVVSFTMIYAPQGKGIVFQDTHPEDAVPVETGREYRFNVYAKQIGNAGVSGARGSQFATVYFLIR
jgi:hypothetical protein